MTCQFSDAIKLKGGATPTRSALSIGLDEVTIGDGMSEVSSVGDLGVEDLHLVSDSNHDDDEDSMSVCSSASNATLFAPDNVGFLGVKVRNERIKILQFELDTFSKPN